MSLDDARIVLTEILSKAYSDSILEVYKKRDLIQNNTITLQKEEINLINDKLHNRELIINNLNQVLVNKDKEILDLNEEIKKQTRFKKLGFIGCVVLPILVLLYAVGN